MKGYKTSVLSVLLVVMSCILVCALPAYCADTTYTNVKDYGAVGDGIADDTAEIIAAITAANNRAKSEVIPGVSTIVSYATVYFPSGKYKISSALDIGLANMMGEGTAIIWQSNPNADIITQNTVYRRTISKLSFLGGQNQIYLNNGNVNSTHIQIEKCHFYCAGSAAIRTGTDLKSTQLVIKDCVFIAALQVLINYCDKTSMENCWITTSPDMQDMAVIENYDVLHVENLLGVPLVNLAYNQRWIDNKSTAQNLTMEKCRFGGEGGGFPAVYNYASYDYTYPVNPTTITFQDCTIYCAAGHSTPCALYLNEIPSQIKMSGCSGMSDVPAMRVNPSINLNSYFDALHGPPDFFRSVSYSLDKTNIDHYYTADGLELPEQMKPFSPDPIDGTAVPTTGWWRVGQFIRNRNCNGGTTPFGWICTAAGKPGTWKQVKVTFQ